MTRLDPEQLADWLREGLAGRGPGSLAVRSGDQLVEVTHGCATSTPCFPVYSIAKLWIAAVLVQQAGEGRLSLEDRVSRWHPDVPGAQVFTVRQLLGHRTGLRDYGPLPEYHRALAASPGQAWSREEYAAHTWALGLQSEPGTAFAYSNPGYRLAQEIASRVDGCPLADVFQRRVIAPLGLSRTFLLESPADYARLEAGSSARLSTDGASRDVRDAMDPAWVFHATLGSTAAECVRVLAALMDGRLVPPDAVAAMTELRPIGGDQGSGPWNEPSYGLGCMGDPRSPHGLLLGHNGGGPGYTASVFHAPEHPAGALTVAVLCAIEDEGAETILRAVLGKLAGG